MNTFFARPATISSAIHLNNRRTILYQFLTQLAQYILRTPFSVEEMTIQFPGDAIIYRSKLNPKINRNFEIFTGPDFLATITQHIPDKGAQMIRYYGWYSNKMRGHRHRVQNGGVPANPLRPSCTRPPTAKRPSKKWRESGNS